MAEIHILPDLLVNKIAAGEVIERPASVVKELVENSLDAGARRVDVALEQGGRKLIRVVDDGCGMGAQDVALCVRPHATSKILCEQDLFSIRTMGFRGEALASVGAVSQLRIISRPSGSDEAHQVQVAADRVEPVTAAAGPPGTTVEVRELFFNVPARQRFLRTPQTEMGHVTEQLARIALAHPPVEFRLTHNDRLLYHLRPAAGMRARIGEVYDRELADALLEVSREERGLRIHGFVARPADSRSSGKWQYVFLNGRFIRDRFVTAAVREAHRGLMDPNRCPVVFLSLEIDPAAVDVNVHPTKIEVRWRDSNQLYSQVLSALRDRFLTTDLTPNLDTARASVEVPRPASTAAGPAGRCPDEDADEERRRRIRASIAEFFKRSPPAAAPPPALPFRSSPAGPPGLATLASTPDGPERAAQSGRDSADKVIQIHRTYLVAESPDGLLIIDQHALHERVLFEQLAAQIARGPLESQRLLIPETFDVSPDQVAVIETHGDTLAQLGFDLTPCGPGAIAVNAAPSLLQESRLREFIRDLLDQLAVRAAPASPELLTNELLSMMACKAAVKAGDVLSGDEISTLMSRRQEVERSSSCPHGRPTSLRLTLRDLERQFKRA